MLVILFNFETNIPRLMDAKCVTKSFFHFIIISTVIVAVPLRTTLLYGYVLRVISKSTLDSNVASSQELLSAALCTIFFYISSISCCISARINFISVSTHHSDMMLDERLVTKRQSYFLKLNGEKKELWNYLWRVCHFF